MQLAGLFLAALIGVSLGLLGGGGSILAVPILVYAVGMAAKPAIAVSLLVVGTTSLIGSARYWRAGEVALRTALLFGVVSMVGAYAGGLFASRLSDQFQLSLFAIIMLVAAISMFRSGGASDASSREPRPALIALSAAAVGVLTGIIGVGGGFLIVPALVLFAGLPMKRAVGTSLLVIALNSASGFIAYAGHVEIAWGYTALFTAMAIVGVFIGSAAASYVSPAQLKRAFAVFLVVVAALVLVQNTLNHRADASVLPAAPERSQIVR